MKNVTKIMAGMSLLGILISIFLMLKTDIHFSQLFKAILILISVFICTYSIYKSKYNLLLLVLSIISFSSLLLILIKDNLFELLWNYVLILHIFLIGFSLSKSIRKESKFKLQYILLTTLIFNILLFSIIILFKLNDDFIYTTLFISLSTTTILFIVQKLLTIARK